MSLKKSTEEYKKDKEAFIHFKKRFLGNLLKKQINISELTENEISKMESIIKQIFSKKEENNTIIKGLNSFLFYLGLSYELLDEDETEHLLAMDLTYENYKLLVSNFNEKYIKDAKINLPNDFHICLEVKDFIVFCISFGRRKLNTDTILDLIKCYFIYGQGSTYFKAYRDNTLFDKIKNEMIKIYPKYKELYGKKHWNRYIEKFLSFFDEYNDYSNELLKKSLDDYYDNKNKNKKVNADNNGYMPLKQKED